jgi:hypothetical protein
VGGGELEGHVLVGSDHRGWMGLLRDWGEECGKLDCASLDILDTLLLERGRDISLQGV